VSATLRWYWDNESETLQAPSHYHDEGVPLPYAIEIGVVCIAYWEGEVIKEGTLEECMQACRDDDESIRGNKECT
jgi:hypothetical protein